MRNHARGSGKFMVWMMTAVVAAMAVSRVMAGVIAVPNFSFESPDVADVTTAPTPTDWTSSGASGVYDPTDTYFAGTTGDNANTLGVLPDGGQEAVITTYFGEPLGGSLSQTVGTVAADTRYTLTVSVGTALAVPTGGWTIELLAGSTVIASNTGDGGPDPGDTGAFEDESATSLFTGGGGDPNVGQPLTIEIIGFNISGNTATEQDQFDNVRLTSVPEPASAMFLTGGALLLLRRRSVRHA